MTARYDETESKITLEFFEGLVTYENTATVDFVITLTDDVSILKTEYTIPISVTKKPVVIKKKQIIAAVAEAPKSDESLEMEKEGVIDYEEQEVEQVMAKEVEEPVEVQKNEFGFVPPRKNQPVARVVYKLPEDMFQREEPTIKKLGIGKVGDLRLDFSSEMILYPEWKEKYLADMEFLRQRQAKIEAVQEAEAEAAASQGQARRMLAAASFGYLDSTQQLQKELRVRELREDLEKHWKGRQLRRVRGLGFAKRSAGKSAEEGVG